MRKDFSGCNAIIYDENDNLLVNVKIEAHHVQENSVTVPDVPELTVGILCKLLILTSPTPYSYQGRIHRRTGRKVITLFKGDIAENRKDSQRYKTDIPAFIEALVVEGKTFYLRNKVEGRVLNISKGGLRLRTIYNAFNPGDRYQIHLKSSDLDLNMFAEVRGRSDTADGHSEFSCQFIVEDEIPEEKEEVSGENIYIDTNIDNLE
ncbi:MAG: PilZ domain-containing protein [Defluviitaleaceae bacterium]|nr:PilZ domain-containing protein [Defluviitaleaceae bacterium]